MKRKFPAPAFRGRKRSVGLKLGEKRLNVLSQSAKKKGFDGDSTKKEKNKANEREKRKRTPEKGKSAFLPFFRKRKARSERERCF